MSGIASLHSAWGAGPEPMLGVNYHLGREDVRISAAHVGTPHRQHGFEFGSNLDLLAHLLPSISILDSGSDTIDSRHSLWSGHMKVNSVDPASLHLWVLPLNPTGPTGTLTKSPDAASLSRCLGNTGS